MNSLPSTSTFCGLQKPYYYSCSSEATAYGQRHEQRLGSGTAGRRPSGANDLLSFPSSSMFAVYTLLRYSPCSLASFQCSLALQAAKNRLRPGNCQNPRMRNRPRRPCNAHSSIRKCPSFSLPSSFTSSSPLQLAPAFSFSWNAGLAHGLCVLCSNSGTHQLPSRSLYSMCCASASSSSPAPDNSDSETSSECAAAPSTAAATPPVVPSSSVDGRIDELVTSSSSVSAEAPSLSTLAATDPIASNNNGSSTSETSQSLASSALPLAASPSTTSPTSADLPLATASDSSPSNSLPGSSPSSDSASARSSSSSSPFQLPGIFAAMWQSFIGLTLVRIITQWPEWQKRKALKRKAEEADANPRDAVMQADYLVELNKVSPQGVIERFERREHDANPQVVAEYLRALVTTNGIADYLADERSGRAATLPTLLNDLQKRSRGENDALPPPGLTENQPLHVVMVDGKPKGGGNRIFSVIRDIIQALMFCFFGLSLWVIGQEALRRYTAGVAGGVAGSAAGGMAGPSSAAAYNPKEYSKEVLPEKSVKKFSDVKGCNEAKAELEEIVEYLKNPAKFTRLGGKLPKGVLLTGPPGTGKTLLAKAIAGEAGVPFYYRAGPEFEEMFVGVGAKRVRSLFQIAKKKSPCIVFIDEIDAIGGSRKQWEGHTKKTLNQLLVEMDGFEANEGIIVLAATNLPETLDPALTRPGRFDRHVTVPNPDQRGRQEILELYLTDKPLSPSIDVNTLARGTPGFSGADLANLVNEAAVRAATENSEQIETRHLEFAKDKILMGAERKSMVITPESLKCTAYHESGHAIVALRTPGAHPIHKATVTPRGDALGMVTQLPEKDETSMSRQQLLARLDVCMGGRVAEERVFGMAKVTSGARSDFAQATAVARHMVCDCGMSEAIGPMSVDPGSSSLSPSTRDLIDREISRLLKESKRRVEKLLQKHDAELHHLAQALIARETLTSKEIEQELASLEAKQREEGQAMREEAQQTSHPGSGTSGSGATSGSDSPASPGSPSGPSMPERQQEERDREVAVAASED
eukprot:TRINITY_DN13758_c0_g1_i2.p1 TRINITY_DN13758_c0_g1~~TRINITY_DN13758_c0_g1_i2.p1  ORF type:complete len:1039 (+),score=196.23 TRINITY_DN13758_c0_g1_i2:171-3287(+)